jgi:hypothetical protein
MGVLDAPFCVMKITSFRMVAASLWTQFNVIKFVCGIRTDNSVFNIYELFQKCTVAWWTTPPKKKAKTNKKYSPVKFPGYFLQLEFKY